MREILQNAERRSTSAKMYRRISTWRSGKLAAPKCLLAWFKIKKKKKKEKKEYKREIYVARVSLIKLSGAFVAHNTRARACLPSVARRAPRRVGRIRNDRRIRSYVCIARRGGLAQPGVFLNLISANWKQILRRKG